MKLPKLPISHTDQIDQPIQLDDYITFTHAYSSGIKLGRVVKLTKQRVKIAYKHKYIDKNNSVQIYEWTYLARPERTIVITPTLDQQLTMLKLKNLIP